MFRRLALLSTLLASLVDAANPKASSLAKEAERLYKDGQYLPAARALEEALALEPNQKLVYNLARAFDQGGELKPALDAYRRYVALPSNETEPDLVKKANLAMDRLRQILARQEADARVNDAEKDRLEKTARAEKERADEEAAKARQQKATFEAKEKDQHNAQQTSINGRRLVAFVVGGVGAAALVTALVLGLLSNGAKEAFRGATLLETKRLTQTQTVTQAVVSDVSLLIGLAAAITAVVLFPKGEPAPDAVALIVAPLSQGAFGALTVTF